MLSRAGHVGVWAGLYGAAAFVCVAQLAGLWAPGTRQCWAVLSVLLIGVGAYALDRVKLRDRWMDPADALAQPARYEFLSRHPARVRVLALGLLAAGGLAGLAVTRWAPVASGMAMVGVALYAPRPRGRRPRLKDIVWTKNAYVALGITGFGAVAVAATVSAGDGPRAWLAILQGHAAPMAWACVIVLGRVWLDAAICDLDDEHADRAHGTSTLATTLGGHRAWRLTGLARPALALGTFACPWAAWHARVAWAGASLAGLLLLRARGRPERVRDLVDARFALEALAVSAALAMWA